MGLDLRTAALQLSAAPDVASALVVGCRTEQQILADYTWMQTRITAEFWAELKTQNLVEHAGSVDLAPEKVYIGHSRQLGEAVQETGI